MGIELDHLFVCAAPGAPEAEKLIECGLRESTPNQHPGQGTACRRFAFANAMIELFWVNDAEEAQNDSTKRTLLWERWSGRSKDASPFGFCFRPAGAAGPEPPFPAWDYRPTYLPDPLRFQIGEAGIEEPMWVYLEFIDRALRQQWFVEHPLGVREITGLTLTSLVELRSEASQSIVDSGILANRIGLKPLLEIEFDGKQRGRQIDIRPYLPILFQL